MKMNFNSMLLQTRGFNRSILKSLFYFVSLVKNVKILLAVCVVIARQEFKVF